MGRMTLEILTHHRAIFLPCQKLGLQPNWSQWVTKHAGQYSELWNYQGWLRELITQDVGGRDGPDHVDLPALQILLPSYATALVSGIL
ncbi:hypothetical protein CK203_067235 [Vitis vinifera]|uniref:Uncharacterized protein n=1 Tax=Vitis vinifera TaxID=29760 RepID=A0A438EG18_VITVI|nr:hypothetical protein CK203_067235 [Vitis vinifera]